MEKPTVGNVIEFSRMYCSSVLGRFFRMGSVNICATLQEFLGDELSSKNNAPIVQCAWVCFARVGSLCYLLG